MEQDLADRYGTEMIAPHRGEARTYPGWPPLAQLSQTLASGTTVCLAHHRSRAVPSQRSVRHDTPSGYGVCKSAHPAQLIYETSSSLVNSKLKDRGRLIFHQCPWQQDEGSEGKTIRRGLASLCAEGVDVFVRVDSLIVNILALVSSAA